MATHKSSKPQRAAPASGTGAVTWSESLSQGKQMVNQPKSLPARKVAISKAPSAKTTVGATRPHSSTTPQRAA